MENQKKVRNLGILAWAPLILSIVWTVMYMFILGDYIADREMEHHMEMAGTTARNWDLLFLTLAPVAVLALAAMLYFIWQISRRTDMPTGQKMIWVVFIAAFHVIAYPVYWNMHIKNDHVPRNNPSPALS